MELLVRQPLDLELQFPDAEIAKEASNILGYHKLLKSGPSAVGPLGKALMNLEIEPFTPASVEKYKAYKIQQALRKNISMLVFGLASIANAGVALIVILSGFSPLTHNELIWLRVAPLILAAGITSLVKCHVSGDWQWTRDALGAYDSPIPVHVLNKALEIKKAFPAASFMVEEMQFHQREVDLTYDPFLYVIDSAFGSKEKYYVEVWDEPEFHPEQ